VSGRHASVFEERCRPPVVGALNVCSGGPELLSCCCGTGGPSAGGEGGGGWGGGGGGAERELQRIVWDGMEEAQEEKKAGGDTHNSRAKREPDVGMDVATNASGTKVGGPEIQTASVKAEPHSSATLQDCGKAVMKRKRKRGEGGHTAEAEAEPLKKRRPKNVAG
jgi:hypothetical protein